MFSSSTNRLSPLYSEIQILINSVQLKLTEEHTFFLSYDV